MRSMLGLALAVAVVALAGGARAENIEFKRVHLVDYNATTGNFLFRGNMPTNNTGFAYDQLVAYMRNRSQTEGNVTMPEKFMLVDISLNNLFDGINFYREVEFWANGKHADLGRFIHWPLGLAGILPPSVFPEPERKKIALSEQLWSFDEIPDRVAAIHKMVHTVRNASQPEPLALYVHCTAGCDRTGEVIGAYRLWYELQSVAFHNVSGVYADDVRECTRPPNYWSTSALEWACLTYQYTYGVDAGNCMGFAKCVFTKDCQPIPPAITEAQEEAGTFVEITPEDVAESMRAANQERLLPTRGNGLHVKFFDKQM